MIGHSRNGMTYVCSGGYYRRRRTDEPEGLIVFGADTGPVRASRTYSTDEVFDVEAWRAVLLAQASASRHVTHAKFSRINKSRAPLPPLQASTLIRWMAKALIGGQK